MELLGSSTQECLTVGGTLAGQEIFTNFLTSVMIHATWPLILNEWVQTKTEGYEDTGINDLVPLCKREKKMKFGKPYML
jgi:hypothetical protein